MRDAKELWRDAVRLGAAIALADAHGAPSVSWDFSESADWRESDDVRELLDGPTGSAWLSLITTTESLGLDECWKERGMIRGDEISQLLSIKGGDIGLVNSEQIARQLEVGPGLPEVADMAAYLTQWARDQGIGEGGG